MNQATKNLVQEMVNNPGVYIVGDTTRPPRDMIVLVSMNGQIFSTTIDKELAQNRFLDSIILRGSVIASDHLGEINSAHKDIKDSSSKQDCKS